MAEGIELGAAPDAGGGRDETAVRAEEDREEEETSVVCKGGFAGPGSSGKEDVDVPAAPPRAYLRKCDDALDGLAPVEGVEMI